MLISSLVLLNVIDHQHHQVYNRSEDEQLALALAASVKEQEELERKQKRRHGTKKGEEEIVDVEDGDGYVYEDEEEGDSEVQVLEEPMTRKSPAVAPSSLSSSPPKIKITSSSSNSSNSSGTSVYSVDDDEDSDQNLRKDMNGDVEEKTKEKQTTYPQNQLPYFMVNLEAEAALPATATTRVNIRLPDGKKLIRRFRLGAPLAALYKFAHQEQAAGGAAVADFDLTTVFPAKSLWTAMEQGETIEGAKLANSTLSLVRR